MMRPVKATGGLGTAAGSAATEGDGVDAAGEGDGDRIGDRDAVLTTSSPGEQADIEKARANATAATPRTLFSSPASRPVHDDLHVLVFMRSPSGTQNPRDGHDNATATVWSL